MGTRPATVADNPQNEVHDALLAEAGWVRGLARSLVEDGHAAEDVAQDALTAAVEKQRGLPGGKLRGWLRGAVRHFAARRRRERRARNRRERQAARPLAGNPDEEAVERLRLHKRLTEAVLSLPEPYRSVVIGRYFDEQSPAEIARERNLRPELVRQQIHRALAMLRARLDREFGDRRAWSTALLGLWKDPAVTAGTLLGVTLMKKLAIAAAAVLLFSVVYQLWQPSGELPVSAPSDLAATQTTQTEPGSPPPSEAETQPDRVELTTESREQNLVLEVVEPAGRPLAGARVWTWSEDGTTGKGATDPDGRIALAGTPAPGGVIVLIEGRLPESEHLDVLQGNHRVEVQPGESLQGWMRVDGEIPREPITFRVISNSSPVPEGIPQELLDEISELGAGKMQDVATAADGSFLLGGLSAEWSGRIELTGSIHWFRRPSLLEMPGEKELLVPEPRSGLQLDLTELPIVQGQVVWSDTHAGVEGASVVVETSFEDAQRSSASTRTKSGGRFRIGVFPHGDELRWNDPSQRSPLSKVDIRVSSAAAISARDVEFTADEVSASGDVGTIMLDRRPIVHFMVRDRGGHPVSGAFVEGSGVSEPTDEEGRGSVGRIDGPYVVGSMGYLVERQNPASGAGTMEDPFVFVVQPGNELVIRLRDSDGRVPEIDRLQLDADGNPFSVATGLGDAAVTGIQRILLDGALSSMGYNAESAWTSTLNIRAEGRLVLPSLRAHAKLTVTVRGGLGAVVAREELVGPGPEEEKEIEILAPGDPFEISGQVLDEMDRPLPGVLVGIEHPIADNRIIRPTRRTGSDGTFLFEPVFLEQSDLRLEVAHPGYASVIVEDVTLGPETGPLVFRMEKGHDLNVHVVDPTGAPVPVRRIHVEGIPQPDDPEAWGSRIREGTFRYADLPAGPAVFWCEVTGGRYEVRHEIHEGSGDARILVPEVGSLVVLWREEVERLRLTARIVSDPPGFRMEKGLFFPRGQDSWPILIPPGDYSLTIENPRVEGGIEVSRRTVHGPVRITIRAREQTEIRM